MNFRALYKQEDQAVCSMIGLMKAPQSNMLFWFNIYSNLFLKLKDHSAHLHSLLIGGKSLKLVTFLAPKSCPCSKELEKT